MRTIGLTVGGTMLEQWTPYNYPAFLCGLLLQRCPAVNTDGFTRALRAARASSVLD
jgi:hypothetical protein